MPIDSYRSQTWISLAALALMAATRSDHFASTLHLPDASWAVFFLAGVYLRPVWALPAVLFLAALIDYVAITWGGVSSYCVSPAYGLLVPAYGVLWLAGRWYRRRHALARRSLISLGASVLVGALLCELLSGGGFYLFSGRFADTSLAELGERMLRYFPLSLSAMAFYVGVVAIVHVALAVAARGGTYPGAARR